MIRTLPALRRLLLPAVFASFAMQALAQGSDDCSQAVAQALPIGGSLTFTGDNSSATATGDFAPGSPFLGAPVIWHAFTLDGCANVTVSYCGQDPVWGNTLGILSTECPADNVIFFTSLDDPDCGDGNTTYGFSGLQEGTYYVPVLLDAGNNSVGPYSIEVHATACAVNNDFCDQVVPQALPIGGSLTFTGDNTNATGTGDFTPDSPFNGASVMWHAFTTTACADVSVSYCGQNPAWGTVFGFLSTGCPSDSVVFFTTFNTTDCGDGNYTYFFDDLAAGTYYVPVVLDPGTNSVGPYSIHVSAVSCNGQMDNNDFCSQVTPQALTVGSSLTFTGDNTNATGTGDFSPDSPFNGASVMWHAFTTTTCADVSVSYCGQSPAWGTVFGFLSTDCPSDSVVFFTTFNTTDCGDGNYTYFFDDLAAGTYYLPVALDPGNNSVGPYSIQVSAVACSGQADNNDFCDQVTSQPLAVGGSLTFTGDNTNATGAGDFAPGSPFNGASVMWHAFTTTECANVAVSYCGQDPVWGTVFGFLSTDCPSDSVVFFSTLDNTTCGDGNTTYHYDQLAAGTYLVPVVLDPGNNSVGPYTIEVSAESCGGQTSSNDLCSQVVPEMLDLGSSLTFTGDNSTATATNDFVAGSPFNGAPVVWHAFTTTDCADVSVSYCGQSPAWGTVFGFLSTDCPSDSVIFFSALNDTICGDGNVTYYYDDLAAGTYLVPVVLDPGNNSVGPYSIDVVAVSCLSTGIGVHDQGGVRVYPVPSDGIVYATGLPVGARARVEVMDLAGRLYLGRERTFGGAVEMIVSAGELPAGAYVVRITTAQGRTEHRVIVR